MQVTRQRTSDDHSTDSFGVQEVARRTGLSDATLRYYERVGLVDAVARDPSSGHRRYDGTTLRALEALACLRATGMGIEEMRAYREHLREHDAAAERELFERHVRRVDAEIAALQVRREYLRQKVVLWEARESGDHDAEVAATAHLVDLAARL